MKFNCLQQSLANSLSIVGRAVPSRTTMPILNNVLLEAQQDKLKLAATNTELSIIHWMRAHTEQEGIFTIPARNFTDLVNSLPNDQVDLELNEFVLNLTCGKVNANFRGVDADEFPLMPMYDEDEKDFAVNAMEFKNALEHVVFSASDDESHPVLTGVLFEFDGDNLTLVTADGFRMSRKSIEQVNQYVPQGVSLIVPAKAMRELLRIIDQDEPILIMVDQNRIVFKLNDTVLASSLLDGNFPDYTRIIPGSHEVSVVVNKTKLLQACRRAAIFAREEANIVAFNVLEDSVDVSSTAAEYGGGETRLDAVVSGGKIEIAVNVRFFIEALSNLNSEEVLLEFDKATNPIVVKEVGDIDNSFVHVVMPMHLGKS